MFDKHREHKAEEAAQDAAAAWQQQRDGYALMVTLAQTFNGVSATDLVLGPSEAVFYKVTGAALVETRRGAGTYEGHSSGFSIPVGSIGGHSVHYRVGVNKGHYVAGAPVATAIDTGTVHITNRRVVFQGANQTRRVRLRQARRLRTRLGGRHIRAVRVEPPETDHDPLRPTPLSRLRVPTRPHRPISPAAGVAPSPLPEARHRRDHRQLTPDHLPGPPLLRRRPGPGG